MALVTKSELTTMNFAFQGQPFAVIAQDDSTGFGTLDLPFEAQPFLPYVDEAAPAPSRGVGGSGAGICIIT